ncbi:hypothetical protein GCM10022245_25260 [Streptomyces mayteni]
MGHTSSRVLVDADHWQFVVQDARAYESWIANHGMDPDLPAGGRTHEALFVPLAAPVSDTATAPVIRVGPEETAGPRRVIVVDQCEAVRAAR